MGRWGFILAGLTVVVLVLIIHAQPDRELTSYRTGDFVGKSQKQVERFFVGNGFKVDSRHYYAITKGGPTLYLSDVANGEFSEACPIDCHVVVAIGTDLAGVFGDTFFHRYFYVVIFFDGVATQSIADHASWLFPA